MFPPSKLIIGNFYPFYFLVSGLFGICENAAGQTRNGFATHSNPSSVPRCSDPRGARARQSLTAGPTPHKTSVTNFHPLMRVCGHVCVCVYGCMSVFVFCFPKPPMKSCCHLNFACHHQLPSRRRSFNFDRDLHTEIKGCTFYHRTVSLKQYNFFPIYKTRVWLNPPPFFSSALAKGKTGMT